MKGAFRTLSGICEGSFLQKFLKVKNRSNYFHKKAPLQMLNRILNTAVVNTNNCKGMMRILLGQNLKFSQLSHVCHNIEDIKLSISSFFFKKASVKFCEIGVVSSKTLKKCLGVVF